MDTYLTADGREWRQVDAVLHTNKDGVAIPLIAWESECVVCGKPIKERTPIDISKTKVFLRKHCEQHKKPWGGARK